MKGLVVAENYLEGEDCIEVNVPTKPLLAEMQEKKVHPGILEWCSEGSQEGELVLLGVLFFFLFPVPSRPVPTRQGYSSEGYHEDIYNTCR